MSRLSHSGNPNNIWWRALNKKLIWVLDFEKLGVLDQDHWKQNQEKFQKFQENFYTIEAANQLLCYTNAKLEIIDFRLEKKPHYIRPTHCPCVIFILS